MAQKLSIASVTVAYNAAHLLLQQLDALQRQSRPLDEIVVVNNASADSTLRILPQSVEPQPARLLATLRQSPGGYA
jgi:GT2 family glycosyltransferase